VRAWIALFMLPAVGVAQVRPATSQPAAIPAGVPLRVRLERRVAIKHPGGHFEGKLAEPIYVFDRPVLPAGATVEGHIAEIGAVSPWTRITALLNGNLTPPRRVRAGFDTLVLSDGSRLPLRTVPSLGTAHTVAIANSHRTPKASRAGAPGPAEQPPRKVWDARQAFQAPGKMRQLESALLSRLPYHRQSWAAGTLFTAVVVDPLVVPAPRDDAGPAESGPQEIRARLLTPLSSATARQGMPVEALVTRPLFAPDHRLLFPEGSRLLGEVTDAHPARWFHRNGKLRIAFRQIAPPGAATQYIQGFVTELESDFSAHLALDQEGAARATSPKTRLIFPAVAAAVAGLSFHQDFNSQGVPDQDLGGRAESGAIGLGLIGTLVAQASRSLASTIAVTGAAFSLYSNFIARGADVVLASNTPIEISLAARPPAPGDAHSPPR